MELTTVEKKLINAINKLTLERDFYKLKSEFLEKNPDKNFEESNPFRYIVKYPKTLLSNDEISCLLEISTRLIDFHEIFCYQAYIDKFMDLFDIQEECRNSVEYNFNTAIYQSLKDSGSIILLETYILNLTDVFAVIEKKKITKKIH